MNKAFPPVLPDLLPLLLLCVAGAAHAGQAGVPVKGASSAPTVTLRGRVLDLKTGEPISKALVSIRDRNLQTATGDGGRFELVGVPPGEADLYVSTVDYGLLKQRIHVDAGDNPELELLLGQEALKHTERITVTSGPFAPTVAEAPVEQSITNTELKNLSLVMLDDPIRAVQNLPGVAADNDWYAQFAVRGAAPAQIGVFVDGALMSAPFHGILDDRGNSCSIGLLDNGFVDSMTLLSGNFPAQYGDFTGSILDVQSRQGNADRTSYRADVSTVAASFSAEGPLSASKKATWFVSARKDFVNLLVGRNSGLGLSFYDAHGNLTYSPTERSRISLSVIHGETSISKDASSVFGTDGLKDGTSRSDLASLRWTWSDGATVSQAEAYGTSDSERDKDVAADVIESSSGGEIGLREDLTHQTGDWNKFQAGAIFRRLDRDYMKAEPWNYSTEEPSTALILTALFSRTVTQPGAYLQDTISLFGKRVNLVAGGRWDHFSQNGENTFLPRVSLSVAPLSGTRLTAAAGQYAQFPDMIDLFGEFGTPTLRPERATHLSLALEQSLGERIRFRVEAYDRRIRDGVYSAASEFRRAGPAGPILYPQLGPVLANSLRGYSRGLEFTLQRRSANRLSGWISYALGYARSVDSTTNAHFWSDFDQRNTVNIFGSYRVTKSVNVSANARYGSGFPIVGYLGAPLNFGNTFFPIASVRNEIRMPAYFRLDTRVNKAFHGKRSKTTLYAEVSDLTNHANYQYWGFVPDYARSYGYIEAGFGTFLKFLPAVGVSVEF